MKVNNNNKNGSNAKKIIPAVGMLSVSAVMLASSTFAWFTMSREVEVTGIKMTASVPEGIEVSLGDGMISTAGRHTLTVDANATNATKIKAPTNNSADLTADKDWTNSVAVSDYYKFGYLLPASSVNGTDIWYTNDANDAGRSVNVNATFAKADADSTAYGDSNLMTTYGVGTTYSGFNKETSNKGYYMDIPVWFRGSVAGGADLAVVATISQGRLDDGSVTGAGGDLYKAARVAILDANSAVNSCDDSDNEILYGSNFYAVNAVTDNNTPANNRVAIADAYYNRYLAAQNVVSETATAITNPQAVQAAGSLNGLLAAGTTAARSITNAGTLYGTAAFVTQAALADNVWSGDTVVAIGAPTAGKNYSDSVEKTIRVWLEGEDVNCWNPNAGQSFTVDLKFVRKGAVKAATAANQTAQQQEPAQEPQEP